MALPQTKPRNSYGIQSRYQTGGSHNFGVPGWMVDINDQLVAEQGDSRLQEMQAQKQQKQQQEREQRIRQHAATVGQRAPVLPRPATSMGVPSPTRVQYRTGTEPDQRVDLSGRTPAQPSPRPSPSPQAPPSPASPRRPFGDPAQPSPFDGAGDFIRGLRDQLGSVASAAMQLPPDRRLDMPAGAQPVAPPAPPSLGLPPDLGRTMGGPSAAQQAEMVRQQAEANQRQEYRDNAEMDIWHEAIDVQGDLIDTASPGLAARESAEQLGAASDQQRDANAIRTAEEKLQRYRIDMARYVENMEREAAGEIPPGSTGAPPPYPELTAAEKGVLDISYEEEVGFQEAFDTYEELTDSEKEALRDAYRMNTGGQTDGFVEWLSENFGMYDPVSDPADPESVSRADAMRASIRNIAPSAGPMTYDPSAVTVNPSRSAASRNDPLQQNDILYKGKDANGNPIQNIPSAQGRGARVPVAGATDTGGSAMARRTAGGDALDMASRELRQGPDGNYIDADGNVVPADQVVVGPNGRPMSMDDMAMFYSQSAGYDFEDMTPAERTGKSRKVYEDHRKRGRSFDTVFDAAAGEDGEFRYEENMDSRRRKQTRGAYGRVYDSIIRDPRAYNDVFLNPRTKEPDVDRIGAWLESNGVFPDSIDSDFLGPDGQPEAAHALDKQRVKNEMVRRIASAMGRSEAYQQQLEMRGNEQNMRNPMLARQMLMNSIREAEANGASPQEIARIYATFGADGSARAEYGLASQQMQADAAVEAARASQPPAEREPGREMEAQENSVISSYSEQPTSMPEYDNAVRYMENLHAENGATPEEAEAQARRSVAQRFLASPVGRNAMDAAAATGQHGGFLRLPAISFYLQSFAENAEGSIWDADWYDGDATKKANFITNAMRGIGLSEDFRLALEDWYQDYSDRASGRG